MQPSKTTGLVIGAGGMARSATYALIQLGCRNIFIYNRTLANAQAVATHFNGWAAGQGMAGGRATEDGQLQVCHVLSAISQPWPRGFQPPTMIISCVPATGVDGSPPGRL